MEKIVNSDLKDYIENKIKPEYVFNDSGHNKEHIECVLKRALELAEEYNIDYNMLYTIVWYHDIACHVNREEHEKLSAKRLYNDKIIRTFFNENQMIIMKDAIEDHRASLEYIPRNIYGKILSSADRKVDVSTYMKSSISFSMKKQPNLSKEELIEESYNFAIKKFGKNGYAIDKMYIEDNKYKKFLDEIQYLVENKEEFINKAEKLFNQIK